MLEIDVKVSNRRASARMTDEPSQLVQQLAALLLERRQCLAVAESCTGGWLAKLMTDLPGSSAWFERGAVTYSNAAKMEMLGVRENTLRTEGAVSAATVVAMAEGMLSRSHADYSIGISGVAGPDGGTPDKPVGLVWLAWAKREQPAQAERFLFAGDRENIRRQAAETALRGLIQRLDRQD